MSQVKHKTYTISRNGKVKEFDEKSEWETIKSLLEQEGEEYEAKVMVEE